MRPKNLQEQLEAVRVYQLGQIKEREKKYKEIVDIAYKCLLNNQITALEYGKIAQANSRLMF